MVIKRYIVNNMNEAMTRIRYELGKDAVIISQRKIKKPGLRGLFSKKVLEVTAAVENTKKTEDNNVEDSVEAIKRLVSKSQNYKASETQSKDNVMRNNINNSIDKSYSFDKIQNNIVKPQTNQNSEDLLSEMKEMKKLINNIVVGGGMEVKKSNIEVKLENNDVNEKVIDKLMSTFKANDIDTDNIEECKTIIKDNIKISDVKMEGPVVLVGPTGVGKTTTIAKLAGRLALVDKKNVGMITIDTYRIGAVEQLKTYADIMNIPFKVVFTMKDMVSAVESMTDCDVILIDTTGRSSKNAMQISELRAFVDKVNTENIHLVVSCTTKNKDIETIVNGYKDLNYNNVIITKLDETTTYGSILNILDYAKKPISFVTTGQNVPDDIKIMTADNITNLVLGEDSIC